jgi:hypothetical protein
MLNDGIHPVCKNRWSKYPNISDTAIDVATHAVSVNVIVIGRKTNPLAGAQQAAKNDSRLMSR